MQVPIRVPGDGVPPSVDVGSRVDVYVSDDAEARRPAVLLLGDVVVTAAPRAVDSLGSSGDRQLVLGVPEAEDDAAHPRHRRGGRRDPDRRRTQLSTPP